MSHREQMWAPWLGFCPRRWAFNALWAQVPSSPSALEGACLALAWPGRGQRAEAACGFGHPALQGWGAVGRKTALAGPASPPGVCCFRGCPVLVRARDRAGRWSVCGRWLLTRPPGPGEAPPQFLTSGGPGAGAAPAPVVGKCKGPRARMLFGSMISSNRV